MLVLIYIGVGLLLFALAVVLASCDMQEWPVAMLCTVCGNEKREGSWWEPVCTKCEPCDEQCYCGAVQKVMTTLGVAAFVCILVGVIFWWHGGVTVKLGVQWKPLFLSTGALIIAYGAGHTPDGGRSLIAEPPSSVEDVPNATLTMLVGGTACIVVGLFTSGGIKTDSSFGLQS